jgi:hypothetical protein
VDVGIKERRASFSLQAPNAFEGSALSYFQHAANMASMEMERCGLFPSKSPLDSTGFALSTLCVFYAWQFLQLSFTCLMGIFMRRVHASTV